MRFEQLKIPAFGPFTNLNLYLPPKPCDLHLIYGENETGKSSLLRAIRDLLFGIHGQSTDNFLHDYRKLRIQGEIVGKSGSRLFFQRRKGSRKTLLDSDDNELPETALREFIGGIDPVYFSNMFGLGRTELREGAKLLLKGEGEIGEALFSASSGGVSVKQVLAGLTEESEKLFKGRATTRVTIRPAAGRHRRLLQESRKSISRPEDWIALEKDLIEKEKSKETLQERIAELNRETEWIARCKDAFPIVGQLNDYLHLLMDLPNLPEVAGNFADRAQSARRNARDAESKLEHVEMQIRKTEESLKSCSISPSVISRAPLLDSLHRGLDAYQNQKERLSESKNKLVGIEHLLRSGMKKLGVEGELDSLEKLRSTSAEIETFENSADAFKKALQSKKLNREKVQELESEIRSTEADLDSFEMGDLEPLRDALAIASRATEADKTIAATKTEIKQLEQAVADAHALVIDAPDDFEITCNLPVPKTSTIRKYRESFIEIGNEIRNLEKALGKEEKAVTKLQNDLRLLEKKGQLPSEETLQNAREHRNHGWDLVMADWKGNGTTQELVPGLPLEKAFPEAVEKADEMVDELRFHAEAVAKAEEKRIQIQLEQKQIDDFEQKLESFRSQLRIDRAHWNADWKPCGITPKLPVEMEEWRDCWIDFRNTLKQLNEARQVFETKSEQIGQAREIIAEALSDAPDKDFTVLFEKAISRVQQGEELSGQRKQATRQLKKLTTHLEQISRNNDAFKSHTEAAEKTWHRQCDSLGLDESVSPESGLALLEERNELVAQFDQWIQLKTEYRNIQNKTTTYETAVDEQATLLSIEGSATEIREAGLWESLVKARKAQVRYEQLIEQKGKADEELTEAQTTLSDTSRNLEEILHIANLDSADDLESLLFNLEEKKRLQKTIESVRQSLRGLSRGGSVDEFIEKVQTEDPAELLQRKDRHDAESADKNSRLKSIEDDLRDLKKKKESLEQALDTAANLRQEAETVAAELKQDASRFLRLRLAAAFLQGQIERFREQNQGPLLDKSARIFSRITRGAFDGIKTEFNAQDTPIMVGHRPDGSIVPVEGMSDGTRDQLYLSLRLAALDLYLEQHEPMPMILDDLLITFDDERARAIIPLLADLAEKTQVFLFTHHEHLVDLFKESLNEKQFKLHRLDASVATV